LEGTVFFLPSQLLPTAAHSICEWS